MMVNKSMTEHEHALNSLQNDARCENSKRKRDWMWKRTNKHIQDDGRSFDGNGTRSQHELRVERTLNRARYLDNHRKRQDTLGRGSCYSNSTSNDAKFENSKRNWSGRRTLKLIQWQWKLVWTKLDEWYIRSRNALRVEHWTDVGPDVRVMCETRKQRVSHCFRRFFLLIVDIYTSLMVRLWMLVSIFSQILDNAYRYYCRYRTMPVNVT